MKKIINKNTILGLIVGIIVSGVTAYAVSTAATDITFKAKNKNWKVGNVADALDSLYISKTSDNYSTDEKVIGTWIDGKPIYQKTIYIDELTSKDAYYSTGISNLKDIINYYGFAIDNEPGEGLSIIRPAYDGNNIGLAHYKSDGSIQIGSTDLLYSRVKKIYIVLQYTKTTDSGSN